MAETSRVEITKTSKPLFLEFCELHDLHDGDEYADEVYIAWTDGLTVQECIQIFKKHNKTAGHVLPAKIWEV